jgi:hypothetical protein
MYYFISFVSSLFFATVCTAQQSIVFSEDFEANSISDIIQNWSASANSAGMLLSNDVPPSSKGKKSLMMTSVIGQNTGGYLYKMFDRGYDTLYYRFYVKFAETCHPVHHFVHMGGYNPSTRWPQGGAGIKPNGNERFTSGIEPMGNRWEWDFYTYWMHMRGNPVPDKYWGNDFNPVPPSKIERGKWYCVEVMMKLNNPVSSYNGEQALWINGEKVMHLGEGFPNGYWVWDSFYPHTDSLPFEGFQWRNDENLNLNFFWLLFYMTQGESGQRDTVWFDDIVVSKEYIGPITGVESGEIQHNKSELNNLPNPFNSTTTIRFSIPKTGYITLKVFDVLGNEIETLVDGEMSAGEHSVVFDAKHLASGVYFYRLTTPTFSQAKSMEMIK